MSLQIDAFDEVPRHLTAKNATAYAKNAKVLIYGQNFAKKLCSVRSGVPECFLRLKALLSTA
jgi:hypothetical protein